MYQDGDGARAVRDRIMASVDLNELIQKTEEEASSL